VLLLEFNIELLHELGMHLQYQSEQVALVRWTPLDLSLGSQVGPLTNDHGGVALNI
jgi:hypothetical protein